MKKVLAAAFGVVLLVGGSIALAGGYTPSSDDEGDETTEVQEVESPDMEDAANADAPGQQVATGADYLGAGPRGLEVAQIAIADHKGDLPAGLAKAVAKATADRSSRGNGAPDETAGDSAN